jgi:hypothetical protein
MRHLGIFTLCLLILLSGCTRFIRSTPDVGEVSLSTLLAHYQSKRDALPPGFRALLFVSADTASSGRHTVPARWKSGDQTEIEGFSLFGNTLFKLTLTESHLTATLPDTRVISVAREEMDRPFSKSAITFSEAVALINWVNAAAIPDFSQPEVSRLQWQEGLLLLNGGERHPPEQFWIDPVSFHIMRIERLHPDGRPQSLVTFDDYRNMGGVDFPFLVNAEADGHHITLKFREVIPLESGGP